MKKLFLIWFLLLVVSPGWAATTYYVGKSGSTGNSCTTAQSPTGTNRKLTIAQGLACTTAGNGDTVVVGNGDYDETLWDSLLKSGASINSPTTLRAENRRMAVIKPVTSQTNDWIAIKFGATTNYFTVDGMKIDMGSISNPSNEKCVEAGSNQTQSYLTFINVDCGNVEADGGDGMGFQEGVTNVVIKDTYIHDIIQTPIHDPIGESPGNHGIYMGSSGALIERVHFKNIFGYGIQLHNSRVSSSNHTIRYSFFELVGQRYGSIYEEGGIYANDGNGNIIHHNIINSRGSRGIYVGGSASMVFNNTIYCSGESGTQGLVFAANNPLAKNNTIHNCSTAISGSSTNSSNNLTTGTPTDIFVSPSTLNFNLKEGSAAIGYGVAISGFASHCVGTCDAGALIASKRNRGEVADSTHYSVIYDLPIQATRNNVGLQTCTATNIALTENTGGGDVGKTESSCSVVGTSTVNVLVSPAYSSDSTVKDAYNRSAPPSLMDSVAIGDPNGALGTNYFNAYVRTYAATGGANDLGGGGPVPIAPSDFRFHQLRGTEAAPALLCATCTQNVSIELPPGAAFRLRFKFQTDGDPPPTAFVLQNSKDAAAYASIPDTVGNNLILWYGTTGSADIPAAGTATTELLTSHKASNTACAVVRSSADFPLIDLNNSETECEYVLKLDNKVTKGTTYDFQVFKSDGTPLDTVVTARLTVGAYIAGW